MHGAHQSTCLVYNPGVARSDREGTIMLLNRGLLYSRSVRPLAATLSVIRWTLRSEPHRLWGINRCVSKKEKNCSWKWSRRYETFVTERAFGRSARGQSCLGIIKGCTRPFGQAFRFMAAASEPPPATPAQYVCHPTITIECSHPLLTTVIANMCSIPELYNTPFRPV